MAESATAADTTASTRRGTTPAPPSSRGRDMVIATTDRAFTAAATASGTVISRAGASSPPKPTGSGAMVGGKAAPTAAYAPPAYGTVAGAAPYGPLYNRPIGDCY